MVNCLQPTIFIFVHTISQSLSSSLHWVLIRDLFIAMATPPCSVGSFRGPRWLLSLIWSLSFLYISKLSGNISLDRLWLFNHVSVQSTTSGLVWSRMEWRIACRSWEIRDSQFSISSLRGAFWHFFFWGWGWFCTGEDAARGGPMEAFCSSDERELNVFPESYCVMSKRADEKFGRPHCKHTHAQLELFRFS